MTRFRQDVMNDGRAGVIISRVRVGYWCVRRNTLVRVMMESFLLVDGSLFWITSVRTTFLAGVSTVLNLVEGKGRFKQRQTMRGVFDPWRHCSLNAVMVEKKQTS